MACSPDDEEQANPFSSADDSLAAEDAGAPHGAIVPVGPEPVLSPEVVSPENVQKIEQAGLIAQLSLTCIALHVVDFQLLGLSIPRNGGCIRLASGYPRVVARLATAP